MIITNNEKITIITLLYLTPMGDIKQHSFEIPSKASCSSWFHNNVKVTEQKKRKLELGIKEAIFTVLTYGLFQNLSLIHI